MLSLAEEIKNRLNIVDVIQGYLKLTKAGTNYKANCPFHKEKTASFVVSPEKQIWHCFGCQKGSDVFGFIMEMEGLEFRDALRLLANKAGVVLRKEDPKLQSERQRLFEINEEAVKFFEENLQKKEAKEARKYLTERGIREKTIKEFRLGYAFDSWRDLKQELGNYGINESDMISAGLVIKPAEEQKTDSNYDRFRSRVMFPIFNLADQVVGFSGRIYPEPKDKERIPAKYINSPNTLIYNKSRTLYGLTKARQAIRKNKFAILVEGNLDVVLSHQAGVKNVLATCGTALNEDHLAILKRYTDKLKLCFDQDEAGGMATKEAIKKALSMGFSLKIIVFKGGKDPADLVLSDPKKWKELVRKGEEFLEYSFKKSFEAHSGKTIIDKKEIAKEVLPLIKALSNKIEQSHWINKLAEELGVDEKYLYEALAKTKSTIKSDQTQLQQVKYDTNKSSRSFLEELLIILLLKYPQLKKGFDGKIRMITPEYKEALKELLQKGKSNTPKALDYLYLKADLYDFNDDEIKKEFETVLQKIKKSDIKEQLQEKTQKLKKLEKEKKGKDIKSLLKEIQQLSEKLTN